MTITNEKRLNEMLETQNLLQEKWESRKKKLTKIYSWIVEIKLLIFKNDLWQGTETEVCKWLGIHRSRIHHIKTHPKKLKEKTIDDLYLNITTVLNKLR